MKSSESKVRCSHYVIHLLFSSPSSILQQNIIVPIYVVYDSFISFYHQTQILIRIFRVRSSISTRVNIHGSSCSVEGCAAAALDTTAKAGMENWNAKWHFLSLPLSITLFSPFYFVHEKYNTTCIPEHTLIGTNTLVCWSRISRIVIYSRLRGVDFSPSSSTIAARNIWYLIFFSPLSPGSVNNYPQDAVRT